MRCLRAGRDGSPILGFPHSAGGICSNGSHWVCWETSSIAAESLTITVTGQMDSHHSVMTPSSERSDRKEHIVKGVRRGWEKKIGFLFLSMAGTGRANMAHFLTVVLTNTFSIRKQRVIDVVLSCYDSTNIHLLL